jgi:formamidopyrimidine-DNA glycosylase
LITFESGLRLAFDDARKFGRVWLVGDESQVLAGLGPEPLDPRFGAGRFHRALAARRRQLKPLLLDQTFLAGLGNIYTDESLHLAGLHPLSRSDTLTRAQGALLWRSIRRTLRKGIRRNGTTIDWAYRGGDFQSELRAYGRTGLPCPVCATPIERLLVGQRGTHVCPRCQPLVPCP